MLKMPPPQFTQAHEYEEKCVRRGKKVDLEATLNESKTRRQVEGGPDLRLSAQYVQRGVDSRLLMACKSSRYSDAIL